ncbi:hypothetical protein ACFL4L_00855 [bacterium]
MNILKNIWILNIILGVLSVSMAEVTVLGDLIHKNTVMIGDSLRGTISLLNDGDESKQVRVSHLDYHYDSSGSSLYPEPGTLPRSNASWLAFSPRQLTVPPNEKAEIYYQVHVPDQDTLAGSYWSVLMIEPIQDIDPEVDENFHIYTVFRYAIQIINTIHATGDVSLQFMQARITNEDSIRQLEIEMQNIGNLVVRPEVWIEVYAETGEFLGKFSTQRAHILPTCSRRLKIDITELRAGIHKAIVIADCGDDYVFGLDIKLDIQ